MPIAQYHLHYDAADALDAHRRRERDRFNLNHLRYDAKAHRQYHDPNNIVTQTTTISTDARCLTVDPTGLNLQTVYTYDAAAQP